MHITSEPIVLLSSLLYIFGVIIYIWLEKNDYYYRNNVLVKTNDKVVTVIEIQGYLLLIVLMKSIDLLIYKYLIKITNRLGLVAYQIRFSMCVMGCY